LHLISLYLHGCVGESCDQSGGSSLSRFGGTENSPVGRLALVNWVIALIVITLLSCSSSASNNEQRRFFQEEYGLETHGRKTWFDHLVEVDPDAIKTTIAPNYEENAPLAVLPFTDRGSANYVVNKIPLTFRGQQQRES
jgi:hypothetical protein